MNKIYNLFLLILLLSGIVSCTKDGYVDYGISNGEHDCSLLEYMEMPGHSYDWDSTALMVRHAGEEMVRLFSGEDPRYPEITFFGFTNHSIKRYLIKSQNDRDPAKRYYKISDLDPEWCKEKLLRHIIAGKHCREDIPEGLEGVGFAIGEGGMQYTTLAGTKLWACTFAEVYQGMEGKGPVTIYLSSVEMLKKLTVASTNIKPNNCVVHSLHYSYTLNDI